MGDVYNLVNMAKTKFSTSKVVLSGVCAEARHVLAVHCRYKWVAQMLGVTSVDPNSWVDNWDFGRDGLHINRRGTRHLGQLYSRVHGIGSGRQKMRR
jgi:hypothetical protein